MPPVIYLTSVCPRQSQGTDLQSGVLGSLYIYPAIVIRSDFLHFEHILALLVFSDDVTTMYYK